MPPPARYFVRVTHAQQIDDSRPRDESRPIIAHRSRNIRPRSLQNVREQIKHARTRVRQKSQCAEWIFRVQVEDVAAHQKPAHCQPANRDEENRRALPSPHRQMPKSGNDPRETSHRQRSSRSPRVRQHSAVPGGSLVLGNRFLARVVRRKRWYIRFPRQLRAIACARVNRSR